MAQRFFTITDYIVMGDGNLYYLLEPDKPPKNDRLVTVSKDSIVKRVTIHCRCLPNGKSPELILHPKFTEQISEEKFRSLGFLTLHELMNNVSSAYDFKIWIVEKKGKKYYKTKTSFRWKDVNDVN